MAQELYYTSAPAGLRPNTRGFCTVAASGSLSRALAERVETLSTYRHASTDTANPIAWAHWLLSVAGREHHVLSRIADAGLDYTQRTNSFAHHLVLENPELLPLGPAWLIQQPGLLATHWNGHVCELPTSPVLQRLLNSGFSASSEPSPISRAWQSLTGDAGWAGVLAETVAKQPPRPVCLLFAPGQNLLSLIAEAIALLPPAQRWQATFNTYFTSLPPGVTCLWRCCLIDTPAAAQAQRSSNTLVLNLTDPKNLPPIPNTPWVTYARTGQKPVTPTSEPTTPRSTPAMPTPSPAPTAPSRYAATAQKSPPPPPTPAPTNPESSPLELTPLEPLTTNPPAPYPPTEQISPPEIIQSPIPPTPPSPGMLLGTRPQPPATPRPAFPRPTPTKDSNLWLWLSLVFISFVVLLVILVKSFAPPAPPSQITDTPEVPANPTPHQPMATSATPTVAPAKPSTSITPATNTTQTVNPIPPSPPKDLTTRPLTPIPAPPHLPVSLALTEPLLNPLHNLGATSNTTQTFKLPLSAAELTLLSQISSLTMEFPSAQHTNLTYKTPELEGTLAQSANSANSNSPGLTLHWKTPADPSPRDLAQISLDKKRGEISLLWQSTKLTSPDRAQAAQLAYWILQQSTLVAQLPGTTLRISLPPGPGLERPLTLNLDKPKNPLNLPANFPPGITLKITSALPTHWTSSIQDEPPPVIPNAPKTPDGEPAPPLHVLYFTHEGAELKGGSLNDGGTWTLPAAWFTLSFSNDYAQLESSYPANLANVRSRIEKIKERQNGIRADIKKKTDESLQNMTPDPNRAGADIQLKMDLKPLQAEAQRYETELTACRTLEQDYQTFGTLELGLNLPNNLPAVKLKIAPPTATDIK